MKTSKVFDTKNFNKDLYFEKLLEAIRDKKIKNSNQVYKVLQLAKLTDHSFSDWFFEKLEKNKADWKDLSVLIENDIFPRTFVLRKLDRLDMLQTSPQSFQEKYAKIHKSLFELSTRVEKWMKP